MPTTARTRRSPQEAAQQWANDNSGRDRILMPPPHRPNHDMLHRGGGQRSPVPSLSDILSYAGRTPATVTTQVEMREEARFNDEAAERAERGEVMALGSRPGLCSNTPAPRTSLYGGSGGGGSGYHDRHYSPPRTTTEAERLSSYVRRTLSGVYRDRFAEWQREMREDNDYRAAEYSKGYAKDNDRGEEEEEEEEEEVWNRNRDDADRYRRSMSPSPQPSSPGPYCRYKS